LGNFLVVEITPPALENIGWRTYLIFAVLNLVNAVIVWLFYPETAGIPLEKIDLLFTDETRGLEAEADAGAAFYRKMQWSVVGKASKEVKRQRRLRKGGEGGAGGEDGGVVAEESSGKSTGSAEHIDKD